MFFGTVTWTFKDGKVMEANYANRWVVHGADTESPKVLLFQAFAVGTCLLGWVTTILLRWKMGPES